ncbi:MAG: conjugal transfer protein TraX [Ruminococcus sp.]|nr:conjugal transfer protein TraX [Ruminococcus sp.]
MDGAGTVQGGKREFVLTGSGLKYIAILAMLCDHIAVLLVPSDLLIYGIMRFFGRITAPVMCFFISEGYHHTRDLKKYFLRLGIFAFISHFAFTYACNGKLFVIAKESVITTLLLSLLAVHIVNTDRVDKAMKLPMLLAVLYFASFCDWGMTGVLFVLAFEFARGNKSVQVLAYFAVAFVRVILPLIPDAANDLSVFTAKWYVLGLALPVGMIMLYNGERGGGKLRKLSKWFFYVFYPAHLFVLGLIKYKL